MSDRLISVVKIRRILDHPRQMVLNFSPSKTKEAPASACDINTIMARVAVGGACVVNRIQAVYADVSRFSDFDFGKSVEIMNSVTESFMKLPAKVRERFGNDPSAFVDFVSDGDNRAEAIELGLVAGETKAVSVGAPVEPPKAVSVGAPVEPPKEVK